MHTARISYLFDSGHIVREPWRIDAASPPEAMRSADLIARARLPLLTPRASVRRIEVKGAPAQRVDYRGTAPPGLAWPQSPMKLLNGNRAARKLLYGAPLSLFREGELTPEGLQAFQRLDRALKDSKCVIERNGKHPEVMRDLQLRPFPHQTFARRKTRPVRLRDLTELLGADAAQAFWDALP